MNAINSLAMMNYAQARMAAPPGPGAAAGEGFHAESALQDFVDTLARHETTARAAMTGGADPHALVEALASSQLAVETVVTVRDKVVEAYQEILRMPV